MKRKATKAELAKFETKYRFNELTGCWDWIAGKSHGYGAFTPLSRKRYGPKYITVPAHRWHYEVKIGILPSNIELHHTCENRGCVNLDHVAPLTEQQHKMVTEGFAKRNAEKQRCPRGHRYTHVWQYNNKNRTSTRVCRFCKRVRRRLAYWREKLGRKISENELPPARKVNFKNRIPLDEQEYLK